MRPDQSDSRNVFHARLFAMNIESSRLQSSNTNEDGAPQVKKLFPNIPEAERGFIVGPMQYTNENLRRVKGPDYAALNASITGKISDEERYAIEDTVGILQTLVAVQDQEPILLRAAKNKALELSTAQLALDRVERELPENEGVTFLIAAVRQFSRAALHLAPQNDRRLIHEKAGGMTEAEVADAKERDSKINIR